nr:MAG TPA: tail tube protein [Caudoviricetes sp.]
MSERVSTAGMSLQYAVESSAGQRPTTGYKKIPEIKSMPSFNPSPNTIDSTTLEETEYMTYVAGLKDLGGALEYGANLTDDLIEFWDELLLARSTGLESGKQTWFAVVHPKLKQAIYYVGEPSPLGLNEASVGGMAETTLYITPNSAPIMAAKPTGE